ncbi:hypothetical protein RQ744_15880 [Roseomonas mucosa]|uniref:DUF6880 family protein n=1 Tax=Roseomonas mucosa TaxID=207340 RepID=UPI001EF66DEA|nr:DUF6880 family protein [Roseomonas mucosa]MCG7352169.1 hypothetical protein [Roseomonas mucosa]MCG7357480.1 hypothetical protein [Roseomonas mucosa]MDT8295458.1 hypothetical protein [Roseomonas mucosa]
MPPRARVSRSRLTPSPVADAEPAPPSPDRPKPKKAAPRSRALSAEALEQLGARRLADLLMAQAKGDTALARTLRLALAETDGGGRLATEVEKRLRTIGRSRGFIEWDKVRPLARELDSLRETIAGPLATTDPRAAVAQMRLLLDLADNVFERSDDGSGTLGEVFRQAGAELGRLWALLPHRDPVALAGEVLALWDADGYGETDRLLEAAGPALGPEGRAELRRLLEGRLAALPRSRKPDAFESWHGRGQIAFRLRDLADLEGDVDAYIAATEAGGRAENFAGDIAERLIAHGRPSEALAWLDRAPGRHEGEEIRLTDLRIAALDALGRREEAQALRWAAFQRWLTPQHLRPYLRGLPDFDDMEAEERAMAHALAHPDRNLALSFLVAWPNLEAANRLVRAHHGEMDGRDYGRLRPAAEALAERYPAAATLLHRTLAEEVLRRTSSRQYQYAVRDVRACASFAALLPEEPGFENHDVFMARLRREHGRKSGFWALLEGPI